MSYVNLHAHSHYSLLDGYGSPKDIVLRTKELGYPAAALTDHGVTFGLVEFYKAAKKEGIKPILGCELYVANRTRFDKEAKIDVKPYHLTILAENNQGYQNLLQLVTKAHLEGFYYKPRVDYGLLKTYSEGLIALSGCLAGHLARTILAGDDEAIDDLVKQYIDIFGKDNYYLEMQDHPLIESQGIVNEKLKQLSKKFDLPLVVTNDSHYPRPEDSDVHDIMICIQTATTVNDDSRMKYTGDFSIRDVNELRETFKDCPEAIDNTLKIAERCNVELSFGENLIPSFATPQNEDPYVYLRKLCEQGLKNRLEGKKIPKEYQDRLDYELETVHKMGFDTYFLIVSDFVRYAREQDIIVGPGRGSAAGSILAWSLGITDLDPIKYGLFFERFLNPERVSMPDIDIDFADNRRDEVLDYVVEKYGRDNVAQIITFGTMAPRAAVRDVGRALGYTYQEVDTLAKTVPPPVLGKHIPLKNSVVDNPELRKEYDGNPRAKVLLDYAMRLEGSVRHVGTHACAVVISEKTLPNYTALQYGAKKEGEIVTQYSAKPLEDLGLLKMDFLGLKNLTVIESTCAIVKERRNIDVDIDHLDLTDQKVFKLFQKGDTTGVFQFESGGMRRYLKQLKPTDFEDIVAMGALYRPGPMDWIPTYIKGKHNPEKVKYLHKSFKSILDNTYGVAVYQEQILQLARDFAGFSLGEADILRKAVGKKIPSLLAEQREKFVKGAVANGHKEKFSEEVFEKVIEPFAGYGFNRAHAVCYGMIAYRTAYLKAHFPTEFMTALLQSDAANTDRVVLEIKECTEKGIDVLPPSINESDTNFTFVNEKSIRFGLMAIKGVGEGPVGEIIEARKKSGPFKSLEDLARRVPAKLLNKKLIQALAYAGALDEFGERNSLAENYEEISGFAKSIQKSESDGQTNIFGMIDEGESDFSFNLHDVPEASPTQKLKWEKEYLGMYVSGHPLKGLGRYIARKGNMIGSLNEKNVDKKIKVVGLIADLRKILTKNGSYMATFVIEDPSGKIRAVMFPKTFAQLGNLLNEDAVVGFSGKLDNKRGQYQIICENAKVLSVKAMIENAQEANLYDGGDKSGIVIRFVDAIIAEKEEEEGVKLDDIKKLKDEGVSEAFLINVPKTAEADTLKSLKELLMKNKGDTPVEIFISSSNKTIRLPFGVKMDKTLKAAVASLWK